MWNFNIKHFSPATTRRRTRPTPFRRYRVGVLKRMQRYFSTYEINQAYVNISYAWHFVITHGCQCISNIYINLATNRHCNYIQDSVFFFKTTLTCTKVCLPVSSAYGSLSHCAENRWNDDVGVKWKLSNCRLMSCVIWLAWFVIWAAHKARKCIKTGFRSPSVWHLAKTFSISLM
jgi:hypothetical protein